MAEVCERREGLYEGRKEGLYEGRKEGRTNEGRREEYEVRKEERKKKKEGRTI
jgi:hypothetical protein